MSVRDKTVPVAAYIPIPSSATPIPRPTAEFNSYNPSSATNRSAPAPQSSAQPFASSTPSFPPSASTHPPTGTRKTTTSSGISGISTNVSDLLLSSLLPPGLPKLPSSTTASSGPGVSSYGAGARDGRGHAKPRELSTVREGLRLDVMSNNFRRFVTKVGPVFWMQDRVEEVLFWRKPVWTWAWILAWGCISFQPRLLLLTPFLTLLVILLHTQERLHPVKTLLGVGSAPSAVTARLPAHKVFKDSPATANVAGGNGASATGRSSTGDHAGAGGGKSQGQDVTTTTGPDGELLPAVPFKEAESGVDYFMNLQAIQNTMGWVSDAYDDIAPILSSLSQPSSTSPTSLPISGTSLIILLLPPTTLLPLTPPWLMPYLLLPIGWGPTLYYHPHLAPLIRSVPQSALARRLRAMIVDLLLTDALPDDIGRCTIDRVEVWENERLDPAIMAKSASATLANAGGSGGGVPPGSWSYRHLRAGERLPWVKVVARDDLAAVGPGGGRSRRLSKLSNASASIRDDVSLSETNSSTTVTSSSSPSAVFLGSRSKSPWYDPHDSLPRPTTSNNTGASHEDESTSAALRLQDGWKWVPGEEWMIDTSAEWCEAGTDSEGWVYSDDSWQSMAPRPVIDAETAGPMPALRRPTRRRRWWRRVYLAPAEELGNAI